MAEDNIDDVLAGADAYPPDIDEILNAVGDDSDGTGAPIPRAAQVRRRALQAQAQANPAPVAKKARGGNRKLLAQETARKALELRKGGATYDQIAVAVGYADASGARKAVKKAIANVTQEPALEVKTIQIERLNHMLLTLWGKVQQGDERAIDTALRVMDRLDALMGTQAATQVDVNINQQNAILVIDGNKDDYIAAMKRMVGVDASGSNIPDTHQITAHPAAGTHPQPVDSAGDNARAMAEDIEDAVIVEDGSLMDALPDGAIDTIHSLMAPPQAPGAADGAGEPVVKKKFNFGVDPTAKRRST